MNQQFPIVISTYMREEAKQQKTYYSLPPEAQKNALVFCRESRYDILKKHNPSMNIVQVPETTDLAIARTRQVVIDTVYGMGYDRCWMIDDQVCLQVRNPDGRIKTIKNDGEFWWLYNQMDQLSQEYVHVSVAHRKDGNLPDANGVRKTGLKLGGRAYSNHAFQLNKLKELGVSFDGMWQKDPDLALFEDFYLVLSLLTKGYPNVLFLDGGFEKDVNKPGGVSVHRTSEQQKKCAHALAAEFPQFVKVVEHKGKWNGDMEEGRIDVQVQWQKALKWGQERQSSSGLDRFF